MSQPQAKPEPDTPQPPQQKPQPAGLKRARSDSAAPPSQTKRRCGSTTSPATPDGTVGSRRKGRIMEVFPQDIFMLMHNTRATFCLFAEVFKQLGQPLGCACYSKIASLVHNGYGPYTKLVSILDMHKIEALAAEKQAQEAQQPQQQKHEEDESDNRIDVGYFATQLRRATEQVVCQAGLQGREATFGLSLIDFVPPGQHTRSTSFFLMYRLAAAASPACAASMMHSAEAADDDLAAMLLIAAASCARPSAAAVKAAAATTTATITTTTTTTPGAPQSVPGTPPTAPTATTSTPTPTATTTPAAAAAKTRSRELDSVFVPATASGRWIVCGVLDIVLSDDSTENLSYRSVRAVHVCLEPQRIIAEFERYILRQDAPQRKTRTRSEAQRMRRRREHIAALRNARSSLESAKATQALQAAVAAAASPVSASSVAASVAADTSSEDDTQAPPTAATSPTLSVAADAASTTGAAASTGTVVTSGESTPASTAQSPQSSSPSSPVGAFVVRSQALGQACHAGGSTRLPSLFELGLLPQSAAALVPSFGFA